jgi:hypothetical protein
LAVPGNTAAHHGAGKFLKKPQGGAAWNKKGQFP